MANQEDETRNEYLKELADREQKVAEGIAEIVRDQKGSAKDRNDLVKQGKAIEKSHRTLGGDLTKNVQDMKDGISTTVDGMINETFGPLGGVVSTFTTGFFASLNVSDGDITNVGSLSSDLIQVDDAAIGLDINF